MRFLIKLLLVNLSLSCSQVDTSKSLSLIPLESFTALGPFPKAAMDNSRIIISDIPARDSGKYWILIGYYNEFARSVDVSINDGAERSVLLHKEGGYGISGFQGTLENGFNHLDISGFWGNSNIDFVDVGTSITVYDFINEVSRIQEAGYKNAPSPLPDTLCFRQNLQLDATKTYGLTIRFVAKEIGTISTYANRSKLREIVLTPGNEIQEVSIIIKEGKVVDSILLRGQLDGIEIKSFKLEEITIEKRFEVESISRNSHLPTTSDIPGFSGKGTIGGLYGNLDFEDLDEVGLNESTLTYDQITYLNDSCNIESKLLDEAILQLDFGKFFAKRQASGNLYLVTTIDSKIEKKLYLLTNGCFGYKIWLNSRLIFQKSRVGNTNKFFENFTPINLSKGLNNLVVKVDKGPNLVCWKLNIALADPDQANAIFKESYLSDFIINPCVENGILQVYPGYYETNDPGISLKIFENEQLKKSISLDSHPSWNGKWSINLDDLEDGLYTALLKRGDDTFLQVFFKGIPQDKVIELKEQFKEINLTEAVDNMRIATLFSRIDHLMERPLYNQTERRFFGRGFVNVLETFQRINSRLDQAYEQSLFRELSGTYIRTYISEIENQKNYSLFHVSDETLVKGKIPLIVILPYDFASNGKMYENWYVSNWDQFDWDIKLANDLGMAVLWPYMRASNTSYIGEKDVFEAIDDLRSCYEIDDDRIYLVGDCTGGRKALVLASHYPDYFAAVAVSGPIVSHPNVYKSPINFIENLNNLPVYIKHDRNDLVAPANGSIKYFNEARRLGYDSLELDITNNAGHLSVEKSYHKSLFKFFQNKKKSDHLIDHIVLKQYELKYNKSHWVTVNSSSSGTLYIDAYFDKSQNTISIDSISLSSAELDLTQLNSIAPVVQFNGTPKNSQTQDGKILITSSDDSLKSQFQKSPHREGPIAHFFSEPFILAEPSTITEMDSILIQSIKKAWSREFSTSMRTLSEHELHKSDLDKNLIIVNSKYETSMMLQIVDSLNLLLSAKYQKEFYEHDDRLLLCFIYPNPISSSTLFYMDLGNGINNDMPFDRLFDRLFESGYYDYVIWDLQKDSSLLSTTGEFDYKWQ